MLLAPFFGFFWKANLLTEFSFDFILRMITVQPGRLDLAGFHRIVFGKERLQKCTHFGALRGFAYFLGPFLAPFCSAVSLKMETSRKNPVKKMSVIRTVRRIRLVL